LRTYAKVCGFPRLHQTNRPAARYKRAKLRNQSCLCQMRETTTQHRTCIAHRNTAACSGRNDDCIRLKLRKKSEKTLEVDANSVCEYGRSENTYVSYNTSSKVESARRLNPISSTINGILNIIQRNSVGILVDPSTEIRLAFYLKMSTSIYTSSLCRRTTKIQYIFVRLRISYCLQ
jgi:hypothetical protein